MWSSQIDLISFSCQREQIGLIQLKHCKPGHYFTLKNQRFLSVTITIAPLFVENNSNYQEIIMNKAQLIIQDISAALIKDQFNTVHLVIFFLIVNRFSRSLADKQIMRLVVQKESD